MGQMPMNKMQRRDYGKLDRAIDTIKTAMIRDGVIPAATRRAALIELLLDECEVEGIHYMTQGCADYDVRIDLRPIEERKRER